MIAWETKRDNHGFTLLEVMISIAIIAIAFVVLLGLRNNDIAINEYSRNLTMASILVQRKISEIELGGFPDLGETGGDFGQELPGFRWTEIVSPTPFDFAREIRVKVSWKSGGREDDVEFITYIANEQ
ncbi:MAG: prepilin-type N-terminal cleavage/methylation domain-containing protein [Nitrospirota bacterium]